MEAYNANNAEMLVIMNLRKQTISFGMGYSVLIWALDTDMQNIRAAFSAVVAISTGNFLGKHPTVDEQRSVREDVSM
jgi:hypothetical protein